MLIDILETSQLPTYVLKQCMKAIFDYCHALYTSVMNLSLVGSTSRDILYREFHGRLLLHLIINCRFCTLQLPTCTLLSTCSVGHRLQSTSLDFIYYIDNSTAAINYCRTTIKPRNPTFIKRSYSDERPNECSTLFLQSR